MYPPGPVDLALYRQVQRAEEFQLDPDLFILTKTIVQLTVRVLFPLSGYWAIASVLPIVFHAVVLPVSALGLAFLSIFFFQPETFYCPAVERSRARLLPEIREPNPLLRELPPALLRPDAPRGIFRGGNNCWLNSDLQLMNSDPFIRQWLRNPLPEQPAPDPKFVHAHRCFQEFYQNYDAASRQNRLIAGSSIVIRNIINWLNPLISPYEQEDAHEGICQILDYLPPEQKIHFKVRHHYKIDGLPHIEGHPNGVTEREEMSWSLELAIQGRAPNLKEMIQMHCDELIPSSNDSKVKFRGIDGVVRHYPLTRVEQIFSQAPPMLRITLKRFFFQKAPESWLSKIPYLVQWFPKLMGEILKNKASIHIPLELGIPLENGVVQQYRLKSFNCHTGDSPRGGHYTSFTRQGEQWFWEDDDRITPVDQRKVEQALASSEPYMIWYERT